MNDIDFVIPWVDGSDPEWQKKKNDCLGKQETDDRIHRYRDWGLLKYWFRGVEKYAPWVRYIWFICDQQPPIWLRKDHPKLKIIKHEDYIPKKYLPTFNSHTIELNLHRIDGLSEHFVYFNDDMFLIKHLNKEYFFKKGIPKDSALLNPIPSSDLKNNKSRVFTIPLNNVEYLNRDYDFKNCFMQHPFKWINLKYGKSILRNMVLLFWPRFVGFDEPHLPQAYLKSSFEKSWVQDKDILNSTCLHSIRNDQDVNQWLIRDRQLAGGLFEPRRKDKKAVFDLDKDILSVCLTIRHQRSKMICLNDGEMSEIDYLEKKNKIINAFDKLLPEKSSYEIFF